MSSIYDSRQRWKLGFIFAAVLIAMASVVVSDLLIKRSGPRRASEDRGLE